MRRLILFLLPVALFGAQNRYARLGDFQGNVEVQLRASVAERHCYAACLDPTLAAVHDSAEQQESARRHRGQRSFHVAPSGRTMATGGAAYDR